ncbi:MAG TPA: DUF2569 family protein [Pyrinomonadaceae bacterium]|nr:DUF2569 family protein [Pyrinomonadaceae bacterium]
MNQDQNTELKFKPVGSRLKGVGGWLAFFIIGQLILRPIATWNELNDPHNISPSQIETTFPMTANIIRVERALSIGLFLFGMLVALTLWKIRTPVSVKLAKIYLVANAVVFILDAFAYKLSDIPVDAQNEIMRRSLTSAVAVTIMCIIWFQYFTKSERVKATYYDDIAPLGLP